MNIEKAKVLFQVKMEIAGKLLNEAEELNEQIKSEIAKAEKRENL